MPQGSTYDAEGNLVWRYDICTEFDCNVQFANKRKCDCKGDFTKEPCMFLGAHIEMNLDGEHQKSVEVGETD